MFSSYRNFMLIIIMCVYNNYAWTFMCMCILLCLNLLCAVSLCFLVSVTNSRAPTSHLESVYFFGQNFLYFWYELSQLVTIIIVEYFRWKNEWVETLIDLEALYTVYIKAEPLASMHIIILCLFQHDLSVSLLVTKQLPCSIVFSTFTRRKWPL